MDDSAIIIAIALVVALVWIALEIRKLHSDLQPVIDSPIVRGLSSVGT